MSIDSSVERLFPSCLRNRLILFAASAPGSVFFSPHAASAGTAMTTPRMPLVSSACKEFPFIALVRDGATIVSKPERSIPYRLHPACHSRNHTALEHFVSDGTGHAVEDSVLI
jgi:hypothetical protein